MIREIISHLPSKHTYSFKYIDNKENGMTIQMWKRQEIGNYGE